MKSFLLATAMLAGCSGPAAISESVTSADSTSTTTCYVGDHPFNGRGTIYGISDAAGSDPKLLERDVFFWHDVPTTDDEHELDSWDLDVVDPGKHFTVRDDATIDVVLDGSSLKITGGGGAPRELSETACPDGFVGRP
jgi:hypothetical protein